MPCPVCDKTFTPLGCCLITGFAVHYCVVCGTVKPCDQPADDLVVPDLVRRCREFEKIMIRLTEDGSPTAEGRKDILKYLITDHWHRLGIAEAIHIPSERKL